jgi:ligand-binding sensor domain-containing protein
MKPWLYILIAFFCGVGFSEAQTPHFEKYFLTRRNEAIQINKIFQSREGYIWFATNKGLFRFDGQAYRSFGLSDSLPDLNVTAIAQDSLGRIWTAHASGKISFYSNNRFQLFNPPEGLSPSPVSDILFDQHNVLWFATLNDGIYYYRNKRLYRIDEENGMPDLYVYDLEKGNDGKIYAGTDGGLVVCDLAEKSVVANVINNKDGLADNIIRKIYTLDHNTLLLGTEDEGVIKLNLKNTSFKRITAGLQLTSVNDIVVTGDRAWIASARAGFTLIDLNSEKQKHYADENGSALPIMTCLLMDSESNIWAGSRTGIFRTLGDELEFIPVPVSDRDPNVMAVAHDHQGSVWFSTQDGLFRRAQVSIGNYTTENLLKGTAFEKFRVISLHVDRDGYTWAGLYGEGVLRINPLTKRMVLLSKQLRNGNVLSISDGGDKTVWLATLGGAEKIQINGEQLDVDHYSSENGLSSDFIYQVFVDSENRVWFATDGKGVDMMDSKGIHHLDEGLTSKVVYGFAEDASGRIWVNTQDAGIFFFNGDTFSDSKLDSVNFRETNNYILTSDHAGRIVAMHNAGIDIYDAQTKSIRYLDEQAGLENRAANLNSVFRDVNDNLLIGTSNGIVILNYNATQGTSPKIHIEGITMVGQKNFLDVTNPLSYDQNNLTISYRGFWYQNPDDVTFEYKMDNYDADWITTGDNRITYSQLPPGDYTFHVRASKAAAAGTESTIQFTIRPPFWKTAGFLVTVVLVMAGLIYSYIKFRERSLREAKVVLEQKVEERTLEIQKNSEEIQAQNEEIMAQAEEIKGINENLEMLVHERTAELERKNKALEEYAFINAHKLRSPVASILGLVNLLNKSELNDECKIINKHLLNSADELDDIVRSITKAIERGEK